MSRIVKTHSTYLDGLISKLKELCKLEEISTITPGVISKTKGRSDKFQLRITSPIQGGYKLIARKGSSVQEVFIITTMEKENLYLAIKKVINK